MLLTNNKESESAIKKRILDSKIGRIPDSNCPNNKAFELLNGSDYEIFIFINLSFMVNIFSIGKTARK